MARWTSDDIAALKQKGAARNPKSGFELKGGAAFQARKEAAVLIGIDPGTNTGFALKRSNKIERVETLTIFEALNEVVKIARHGGNIFVRMEDARLRTWFGNTGKEKLKGAGSVERDCTIWVEVLEMFQVPYELVHPKNVKATTAESFEKLTGWKGRTSIHAREAAWLIL